jgi:hypothetical protein
MEPRRRAPARFSCTRDNRAVPHDPLWTCPACGQTFVSRNMPHSCQVVGLERFFDGVAPELRELFERYVAAARLNGDVTVNATKSRVALQVRGRFAGIERPPDWVHVPAGTPRSR